MPLKSPSIGLPLMRARFAPAGRLRSGFPVIGLLLLGALALLGGVGGCGKAAVKPRALVLGLDGATWKILRPMMDKGELPNLKALADGGISGNLRSVIPFLSPPAWTSGTLFPQASRKTARAINATTGNRPLVVMANLSGFDGSPESMRKWQLEYGAEIGRAITNFKGPIVFIVVSRYHGGAFVVFSKALTENMEIAAIEGSYASVIGGAPAAATVFARDVKIRTDKDPRVLEAQAAAAAAKGPEAGRLRAQAAAVAAAVRSEKLGEVADEFDSIHTIERAQRMGSVDRIISAESLRPYVIDALERGMAKFTS